MSPHRVLVPLVLDGALRRVGETVDFAGADWKMEPLDPDARARWERHTAQPERVAAAVAKLEGYPEAHAAWIEHHKHVGNPLPVSGFAASGG